MGKFLIFFFSRQFTLYCCIIKFFILFDIIIQKLTISYFPFFFQTLLIHLILLLLASFQPFVERAKLTPRVLRFRKLAPLTATLVLVTSTTGRHTYIQDYLIHNLRYFLYFLLFFCFKKPSSLFLPVNSTLKVYLTYIFFFTLSRAAKSFSRLRA